MELGYSTRRSHHLLFSVILITILAASQVQSAAFLSKRSIVRRSQSNEVECRTNAPCGWEVYNTNDSSARQLLYYVASSCKCSTKETCIRTEDDISINAYTYRCRDVRKKSRTTTRRPLDNNTSS